jgi:ABC-type sugar transport system ATPase subunit
LGCGKSTLLRIISGLEEATSGIVEIDGVDVTNAEPSERGIAIVFQSYALYPHLTVEQNIGFGLSLARRHTSGESVAASSMNGGHLRCDAATLRPADRPLRPDLARPARVSRQISIASAMASAFSSWMPR